MLKIISWHYRQGCIGARLTAGNFKPLNIIACENMVRERPFKRAGFHTSYRGIAKAEAEKYVGFVDSAVDRIVPPVQEDISDPLLVTVE